tara:strand:- start:66 stop:299 length:234 start_codon:yes stop_codon:yes gene_type:complete
MTNLFRILSQHFDDDKKLGAYIRMLGEVPDADLKLPEGFTVSWTVGENNVYHAKESFSLDEILDSAGIKGVSGGTES